MTARFVELSRHKSENRLLLVSQCWANDYYELRKTRESNRELTVHDAVETGMSGASGATNFQGSPVSAGTGDTLSDPDNYRGCAAFPSSVHACSLAQSMSSLTTGCSVAGCQSQRLDAQERKHAVEPTGGVGRFRQPHSCPTTQG
jgi:hypothetical protein